ncbi:uncharacterized protein LOC122625745 [Drosophila teissieri]|uniref:uncharacterized protein LOC122625745 n=1 Tax=Drosophila teissieri TaxID=7243 RepID=UPI001CBA178C|nr:uncharacterized protein LOC122625745 [Drosophila teissieri]
MREVLGQSSPPCDLPGRAVYAHLRQMFARNADERVRPFDWPAWCVPGEEARVDTLVSPLTQEEVLARLRRTHSSAPGPDGVTYGNLKKTDPKASMLTAVFNACLRTGHVPDLWKKSRTVLIHKKGDRTDLSNWRPLSMGDTIPKLFAAVMADRLTAFLTNGGRLSEEQKGFLQHEGCHEHNFVLGQVLEESRRQGKDLIMDWMDLSNAFGSIPHATIMDAVAGMGIPSRIRTIIHQLATGAATTLHLTGKKSSRRPVQTGFLVRGTPIPAMTEGDAYEYLGIPVGLNVDQTPRAAMEAIVGDIAKIDDSLLAPWQKIDAARTFVAPKLDFVLRSGATLRAPLRHLDTAIKEHIKKWLYLPQRASAEVVYTPLKKGGAGILPSSILATIAQAHRMVSCPGEVVSRIAREGLREAVKRKINREPSGDEMAHFLSGSTLSGETASFGDAGFWSRVRMTTKRQAVHLGVRWAWRGGELLVECRGQRNRPVATDSNSRSQLIQRLRCAAQDEFLTILLNKPDQGKVAKLSTLTPVSNAFIRDGSFTRFADWRFIHRARLGVLPVNGAIRWGSGDKRCRVCGYQLESVPHVLCHCMHHSNAIQQRHNAVMDRLAKAGSRLGTPRVNCRVEGVAEDMAALRPDLVWRDERSRKIVIVDVTVPFENGTEAFDNARGEKEEKYRPLAEALRAMGYQVKLEAFIVGALGSWDPKNERVLKTLGVSRFYAGLMRRLMVADTIRWSRDIYVEHVSGIRQFTLPSEAPSN